MQYGHGHQNKLSFYPKKRYNIKDISQPVTALTRNPSIENLYFEEMKQFEKSKNCMKSVSVWLTRKGYSV